MFVQWIIVANDTSAGGAWRDGIWDGGKLATVGADGYETKPQSNRQGNGQQSTFVPRTAPFAHMSSPSASPGLPGLLGTGGKACLDPEGVVAPDISAISSSGCPGYVSDIEEGNLLFFARRACSAGMNWYRVKRSLNE